MEQAIQRVLASSSRKQRYKAVEPILSIGDYYKFYNISSNEQYAAFVYETFDEAKTKVLITDAGYHQVVFFCDFPSSCVAWAPNSRFTAVAGGSLQIVDLINKMHTNVRNFGQDSAVCVDWSSDGKLIAVLCTTSIYVFNADTDGNTVSNRKIRLKLMNGSEQRPVNTKQMMNHILLWSPDSSALVFSATSNAYFHVFGIWNTTDILSRSSKTMESIVPDDVKRSVFEQLVWSPDSKHVLGFRESRIDGNKSTSFTLVPRVCTKTTVCKDFRLLDKLADSDFKRIIEWSPEGNLFVIDEQWSNNLKVINVADLIIKWSDRTNYLFGGTFRKFVFLMMCIHHRLEKTKDVTGLTTLPLSLWLIILQMCRSTHRENTGINWESALGIGSMVWIHRSWSEL